MASLEMWILAAFRDKTCTDSGTKKGRLAMNRPCD
jgi:hypothetical protein